MGESTEVDIRSIKQAEAAAIELRKELGFLGSKSTEVAS